MDIKLINLVFTKILFEKEEKVIKKFNINSQLNIKDIIKEDLNKKSKEHFLKVSWSYSVNYDPKIANILIEGNLIISLNEKEKKKILSSWKKKSLDKEFNVLILNVILRKCNIKLLQLEEDFNLPPHFTLPSVKLNE